MIKPMMQGSLLMAALAGAGCSYFGTEPDTATATHIHDRLPHGMAMDTAESRLVGLGFGCTYRGGDYETENGHTRTAERFLICERRPSSLSFRCENRDHVVVVPDHTAVIQAVEVTRGPSCASP